MKMYLKSEFVELYLFDKGVGQILVYNLNIAKFLTPPPALVNWHSHVQGCNFLMSNCIRHVFFSVRLQIAVGIRPWKSTLPSPYCRAVEKRCTRYFPVAKHQNPVYLLFIPSIFFISIMVLNRMFVVQCNCYYCKPLFLEQLHLSVF